MEAFIETILNHDIVKTVIEYVNSMGEFEISIVVVITGILILFIVGRWFGSGAVIGLAIVYIMIYGLYVMDFINLSETYEQQGKDRDRVIQEELEKK